MNLWCFREFYSTAQLCNFNTGAKEIYSRDLEIRDTNNAGVHDALLCQYSHDGVICWLRVKVGVEEQLKQGRVSEPAIRLQHPRTGFWLVLHYIEIKTKFELRSQDHRVNLRTESES